MGASIDALVNGPDSEIASHAAVIDKGHIVHRDDVAGLRANADIRRRYLAM